MTARSVLAAGGRARGAILLVAGVAAAGMVGRDALVAGLSRKSPDAALRWSPADPVALKTAFGQTLENGAPSPAQMRVWAGRARAALRVAPLNAAVIRMAATDPDRANADRLLQLAERASRRDALLQLALIEAAVRRNQIGEALDHYDRALSVYPDMRSILFPVLANAVEQPEVRDALARPARAHRPWMIPFLSYAVAHTPTPGMVAALLDKMRDPHGAALDVKDQEAAFTGRLMGLGNYTAARATARMVAGTQADAIDRAGFSPATWTPALRPLTWTPGGAEGVDAQLDGDGTATVTAAPGSSGTALLRILVPAPGRYRFAAAVAAPDDGATAVTGRWALTCLRENGRIATPLAELTADPNGQAAGERVVDVPAACGAVRIVFTIDNLDGGTESALVVRNVVFAPAR